MIRMCRKHNRPISKNDQKKGHKTSECSRCKNERQHSQERRKDGIKRPKRTRREYRRMMEKREQSLATSTSLQTIEIFERLTGFTLLGAN